jgi:hypothetical protein
VIGDGLGTHVAAGIDFRLRRLTAPASRSHDPQAVAGRHLTTTTPACRVAIREHRAPGRAPRHPGVLRSRVPPLAGW